MYCVRVDFSMQFHTFLMFCVSLCFYSYLLLLMWSVIYLFFPSFLPHHVYVRKTTKFLSMSSLEATINVTY